jgi:UDP-N-acetylmuramoylalanine--D-glutamate ligase
VPSKSPIIIGLGKTGLSFAHYLTHKKLNFEVMDSRENPPNLAEFRKDFPNIKLHLGPFDRKLIESASELFMSPGIDPHDPVFNGAHINGDIEVFAREAKAPIIAITGTNAKGTVTTLVGYMIRNAGLIPCVGGNIGTPALDLLNQTVPNFYVLEISSFQLETTHNLPAVAATILNMSPDHLDRHHTMESYHAAKQRIYRQCETAVVNQDDPYSNPDNAVAKKIMFSINSKTVSDKAHPQFHIYNNHLAYGDELLLPTKDLLIQGKHNWSNALAALALGKAIHLPIDAMLKALREFPGLEHRCEWVATKDNIHWINDSKGTNIGATIAALEGLGSTLDGKIVLIAGGIGKNADFSFLRKAVEKFTRQLILFGRDAQLINQALKDTVPIQMTDSLAQAIKLARNTAATGDAVLLSPACASFDMFRDYEHRGQQFKRLVREFLSDDINQSVD